MRRLALLLLLAGPVQAEYEVDKTCALYVCLGNSHISYTNSVCVDARAEVVKRTLRSVLKPWESISAIADYASCLYSGPTPANGITTPLNAQKIQRSYSKIIMTADANHPLGVIIVPGECEKNITGPSLDIKEGECSTTLMTYTLFLHGEQYGTLLHINEETGASYVQDPETGIAEQVDVGTPAPAKPVVQTPVEVAAEVTAEPRQAPIVSSGSFPRAQAGIPSSAKPSMSAPALGVAVSNGVPNQTIRRVSNDYEIHSYSKRPAITIDNQYVLVGNKIRRISDGSLVASFPAMNTESVVSLANADTVWGVSGGNVIKGSISSGRSWVHMSAQGGTLMGQYEGGMSADDRFMVVDKGRTLMVLDLVNKTTVGSYTAGSEVNGLHISLDGQYVAWVEGGMLKKATRTFSDIYNTGLGSSHSDFAIDANGDQVYVHFTASDYFTILNMRTNQITRRYFGTSTGNGHVSGRNVGRPGWAYFSFYNGGRLAAVKLDYEPTITTENWGHFQDDKINYKKHDYYDTAKLTVSKDGQKILVTSTWNKTQPRRDYIVENARAGNS